MYLVIRTVSLTELNPTDLLVSNRDKVVTTIAVRLLSVDFMRTLSLIMYATGAPCFVRARYALSSESDIDV